jgi:hypothetical protein
MKKVTYEATTSRTIPAVILWTPMGTATITLTVFTEAIQAKRFSATSLQSGVGKVAASIMGATLYVLSATTASVSSITYPSMPIYSPSHTSTISCGSASSAQAKKTLVLFSSENWSCSTHTHHRPWERKVSRQVSFS